MAILGTSKYEEDPIKIESARVATTLNIDFSNTQGQVTPRSDIGSGQNSNSVRGGIWLKLEPIRDIIVVLVTCKNEEDPMKNRGARVATTFFLL